MRWLVSLSLAVTVALAACGNETRDEPRNAEDAAREWVEAINAKDWNRACELSVKQSQAGCERVVAEGFGDAGGDMRIERIYRSGDTTKFAVTTPDRRNDGGREFAVERHHDEHLVHFEISIIR